MVNYQSYFEIFESDTLENDPDDYQIKLPEEVLALFVAKFPNPLLQPHEHPPDDTVR